MTNSQLGVTAPLPSGIDVLPDTEVEQLWTLFRFFEAGHHNMEIMNPLSSDGLDEVVQHLDVRPDDRVLDVACGHGDLLLRLHDMGGDGPTPSQATGVDLSPWTIRRARQRLSDAGLNEVDLVLADGKRYLQRNTEQRWDIISLIGAPWIWGGFGPSVDALSSRLNSGGRLVIADIVATSQESRARLDPQYDDPGTADELRGVLHEAGLETVVELETSPQDWRDYDDRTLAGLRSWIERFPQDGDFIDRQMGHEETRADDADVGWRVWICRRN